MVRALLAAQMQTTLAAVREFDLQIEELCQSHDDCDLFASLPGAGRVYAARLLTAFGTIRERWASADELLRLERGCACGRKKRQIVVDKVALLVPEILPPILY